VFAVALLDASIIGAFAVSLSSAYAIGDVLGLKHSLHRGFRQAKGFYAIYAALIAGAAAIVLIPGSPLGLLTEGVQALAGVLLPSATVYLLLLCNDRAVLGPWVNGRKTTMFAATVVALLVALSVVLTASVLFPNITARQIIEIICVCGAAAAILGAWTLARVRREVGGVAIDRTGRENWRMPPLTVLSKPVMSASRKVGLTILRSYLALAMILVVVRLVQMALARLRRASAPLPVFFGPNERWYPLPMPCGRPPRRPSAGPGDRAPAGCRDRVASRGRGPARARRAPARRTGP